MAVVAHRDEQRQVEPLAAARDGDPHAVLKAGRQNYFGKMDAILGHRIGGILHQVQHHLDQLVTVRPDRRQ